MAYTEFYCQSGGSNVNAGSTTSNSPTQKVHGNWTNATGVYTVQDGTNPTAYCSVGDWVAVMVDGGSVAAWVARVTAVQNATNGTITANTSGIGSKPANQSGTATITIGGAWLGPNAASGFPLTLTNFGDNKNAAGDTARLNLKNDQTYTMTASFAPVVVSAGTYTVQGYTSSTGDGGKATFDGTTSTNTIMSNVKVGTTWIDLIFKTAFASGSADLIGVTGACSFIRCVFTGSRGNGLNIGAGAKAIECEAYGNNTSNTAAKAGFNMSIVASLIRCISHDNTGSNTAGIALTSTAAGGVVIDRCILDSNGGFGVFFTGTTPDAYHFVLNSDFYNNGSDGINIASGAATQIWIENCNFIKNTGAGINNASTLLSRGFVYNCGYGAGTQANGSADTLNNLSQSGTVTYANDVTPWVDPANGDFSINFAAAQGVGRGAFTETAASYTGTVGYPDIGAAQALVTSSSAQYSFVFGG